MFSRIKKWFHEANLNALLAKDPETLTDREWFELGRLKGSYVREYGHEFVAKT